MDANTLVLIGILGGVLILSGWVQQIIKGYRTKSLRDVSRYLILLIFAGAVMWVIYGIEIADIYVIGTNVAAMVLMIIVIMMKYRYDKNTIK